MSQSAEALVREFFDSLGPTWGDLTNAINRFCSDDCVWENSGLPSANGREAMLAMNETIRAMTGMESMTVINRHILADETTVLTERVDELRKPDGTVIATVPVMGTIEVRDGQVAAWRDYFDSSALQALQSS